MSKEIERKFLINRVPDGILQYPNYRINQGYIAVQEDGREVRIRAKDNIFTLTIKSAGHIEREEIEVTILKEQYETLINATINRHIDKTRYLIPYGDRTIELDIYQGNLEGLIIAEIEFSTVSESELFDIPMWFDEEVTFNPRYKNKVLSQVLNKDEIC